MERRRCVAVKESILACRFLLFYVFYMEFNMLSQTTQNTFSNVCRDLSIVPPFFCILHALLIFFFYTVFSQNKDLVVVYGQSWQKNILYIFQSSRNSKGFL